MERQRSTIPRGLSVWADRPAHGLRLMASTILCQFTLTPRFLAKRKVDDDDEMLPSTGSPSHCFHATLSAIFWVFSVLASFMCRCIATTTTIRARQRPQVRRTTNHAFAPPNVVKKSSVFLNIAYKTCVKSIKNGPTIFKKIKKIKKF